MQTDSQTGIKSTALCAKYKNLCIQNFRYVGRAFEEGFLFLHYSGAGYWLSVGKLLCDYFNFLMKEACTRRKLVGT
jgi:hypothetical protein